MSGMTICKDYDTAPRAAQDAARKAHEDLAKYSTEFAMLWTRPLVEIGLHPAQATAIAAAASVTNGLCLMQCIADLPDGKDLCASMFEEMHKKINEIEKEIMS